jgi:hypothetical protein
MELVLMGLHTRRLGLFHQFFTVLQKMCSAW